MGYINKTYLQKQFDNFAARIASVFAKNTEVPTKTSQLTNDSGYITGNGTAKTISDVLPISKGGTGKTTGADAANALIGALEAGDTAPTDATNIIVQGVGNYSGKYYRKPVSLLWNYIKSKLATVATSGSYNDLSNKPTIPSVGNGTITIKQAGTTKGTFTTNQSGNTTIELTDNNTTYGVATPSALGLVKSGTDITVDSSGNVSVNDDSHNHVISNVDGLQSALDGKAASSHKQAYTASECTSYTTDIDTMGVTPAAVKKAITEVFEPKSHTHSAYVNQNAFSNVVVGSTTVAADSATDTLTLVAGSNVTLTPDATNDKITISATDTYDRVRYNSAIKCGTTAIVAGNIIVGKDGVYEHLKLGNAFDITYPILYANANISASRISANNYLAIPFTVTTTQSMTLTAFKPVFIKGKLYGTIFTPISTTSLTQETPSEEDGYEYILLGVSYNSSNQIYLLPNHPIFKYRGGALRELFEEAKYVEMITDELGTTWTRRTTGMVGYLYSVTYGNGKFIAVGQDGLTIYSEDGITWTAGGTAGSSTLRSVTYGNGKFVAVDASGATYYSEDGITWTAGGTAGSSTLFSVTYANGKFVTVGTSGVTYYSEDGITWTAGGTAGSSTLYSVTYGNGKFVTVGNSVVSYYSENGISWTAGGTAGTNTLRSVTYGNGKFVAVGTYGATYYSEDGITWTAGGTAGSETLYSVTYGNGKFVTVSTVSTGIYYLNFIRESKLIENVINDLWNLSKELDNDVEELRDKTPQLISEGVVTNETITLDMFEAESSYLLVTKANTKSTGKIYGSYIVNIVTPASNVFGIVANTQSSVAKTTNTGLTLTMVADGTVTIKVSSTYEVFYQLYKL